MGSLTPDRNRRQTLSSTLKNQLRGYTMGEKPRKGTIIRQPRHRLGSTLPCPYENARSCRDRSALQSFPLCIAKGKCDITPLL